MIVSPSVQTAFLNVKFYGVFMAGAMLLGSFASYFIAKKYYKNVNLDYLLDLFPILIISGIIGARIYYVLLNADFYFSNLSEIFMINHGGISIHGAILGGLAAAIIFCKKKKINLFLYADVVSYGLILAQAIGRLGNFFNSEAFGKPTDLAWKMYVAPEFRPLRYASYEYFHPTFLYEIIWNIFVFTILFFAIRKIAKNKTGVIFFSYLIFYSIGRFLIEGIRIDSVLDIYAIPFAQIVSILLIIAGFLGIFFVSKKQN